MAYPFDIHGPADPLTERLRQERYDRPLEAFQQRKEARQRLAEWGGVPVHEVTEGEIVAYLNR